MLKKRRSRPIHQVIKDTIKKDFDVSVTTRLIIVAALCAALPVLPAAASVFGAAVDDSRWEVAPSLLECRMSHPIPVFGKAVFTQRAGEPLAFHLDAWQNPMQQGEARISVEPPAWKPHSERVGLGKVPVRAGVKPIVLDSDLAARILEELRRGNSPTFTRTAWYKGAEEVRVAVSAVNFQSVYRDYMACMAQLLPVNFEQISRSVLLYSSEKWRLSAANRERLDLIVRYLKADPTVAQIYVDGHSDSYGRRIFNRKLSKQRAYVVTAYLLDMGVSEEMITTRYHGERFPVADNRKKAGRDRNRRVTVRLEREDPAARVARGSTLEEDSGVRLSEEP